MPSRGGAKMGELGSSRNVQYLVGSGIDGAFVGFTSAEFNEGDGSCGDIDCGDSSHGGASGCSEKFRGDGLDAVGRRSVSW